MLMVWFVWCLAAAAAVLGGWYLAMHPQRGKPGWEKLSGHRYAHRGLHDLAAGRPENSLAAFRAAAEAGFGAELDVHLMADGNLAVVHDADLARVCGKHAVIETLRREDLADYPLLGSGESIPLLEDVLAVFEDRGPLIIELKVRKGGAAALTAAVMERLRDWKGQYCLESFHPAVLMCLRRHWPEVFRGQLSCNFFASGGSGWGRVADWAMTHLLVCLAGRPDFVAYRWEDRHEPSLRLMKRLLGVHEVAWTVREQPVLERLEAEGAAVIFEGFIPASPASGNKA